MPWPLTRSWVRCRVSPTGAAEGVVNSRCRGGSAAQERFTRCRSMGMDGESDSGIHLAIDDRRWKRYAACRDLPTSLFFPGQYASRARIAEATKVCDRCEVRQACLDHALANADLQGIWGGTTEGNRRDVRMNNNPSRFPAIHELHRVAGHEAV